MSYSSTSSRTVSNEEYLQQKLDKISFDKKSQEDGGLHVNNDGGLCGISEGVQEFPMGSNGSWDYSNHQTRNMDAPVTELTPEEVRWFYKSECDKRWQEFSGYDSHHIELKYREMYDQVTCLKFSAFSDPTQSSGSQYTFSGSSRYFGASSIRFPTKQSNQYSQSTTQNRCKEQIQNNLVVRGGLYDINFETWKCSSIYWPGEEYQITRGTWFYEGTWQPLDQEHSQTLESKHLFMFEGHKPSEYVENEAKGIAMHTENFPDFIVEWISPNQIYLYSEKTPSKVVRTVSTRLGFRKSSGYRLFRGYKNEASLNDRPDVEITHLVFVIHGIGQKMDTGRIIRNTSSFRDCVSWLKQKYFSNFPNHRAEFFPVEWRSNLQLDGDLVDAITPNTLQSLRQMLNASAMDIMYYTSPLYGGEVQKGLREELNRLYSMFSARNPYFLNKSGKISIIAHSLGCVILYDIIMGLKPGSLVQNNQHGLLFQVQNFFCLGSPLSVFLALRWKDSQIPNKAGVILPQRLCHRLYNVFHPTDPVAYRIEPLLVKGYSRVAPLVVQSYNASFRMPYAEMPAEIIVPEQQSSDAKGSGNNKGQFSPEGLAKDKSWSLWGLRNKGSKKSADESLESLQEELNYRLDYILRESNLGVSYLSALTSHTAYWTNYDVAYFILTQIFPEFENNESLTNEEKISYRQNYPHDFQSVDYENQPCNQFDNSNYEKHYISQQVVSTRQPPQPLINDNVSTNPETGFQPPHQNVPDYKQQQYTSSALNQDCRKHQPGYPPPHASEFQHQYQQQILEPYELQGPRVHQQSGNYPHLLQQEQLNQTQSPYKNDNVHQALTNYPQQNYRSPQNYIPPQTQSSQQPLNYLPQQGQPNQSPSNYSQQKTPPINYSLQQSQTNPSPPLACPQNQVQLLSSGYSQGQHTFYPEQAPFQQNQPLPNQQPQSNQAIQMKTGQTKNILTKTGLFDKITEDKKTQGAPSPTKNTKSFFPSFNLSSLTSPVKNLSNSLSNISSQMTNLGTTKDNISNSSSNSSGGANVQIRSPAVCVGNTNQKNMSPNYAHTPRSQSPQVQYNQVQMGQYQQINQGPLLNQNIQQNIRSGSPYEMHSVGIRSGSPNRCSPMQYGPIETPVGAIKPKSSRLQPKVPALEQKVQYGFEPSTGPTKARCVSPLGQSRVVFSGSRNSFSGNYGLPLGGRSLSSGNLRNSTLVSGTYAGNCSNYAYPLQTNYVAPSSLDRRTMSRPNLSTTGNNYIGSGLGMSNLVYNFPYGSNRTYLNREYSGPSSR